MLVTPSNSGRPNTLGGASRRGRDLSQIRPQSRRKSWRSTKSPRERERMQQGFRYLDRRARRGGRCVGAFVPRQSV
jgi:hypothetical protein